MLLDFQDQVAVITGAPADRGCHCEALFRQAQKLLC